MLKVFKFAKIYRLTYVGGAFKQSSNIKTTFLESGLLSGMGDIIRWINFLQILF